MWGLRGRRGVCDLLDFDERVPDDSAADCRRDQQDSDDKRREDVLHVLRSGIICRKRPNVVVVISRFSSSPS